MKYHEVQLTALQKSMLLAYISQEKMVAINGRRMMTDAIEKLVELINKSEYRSNHSKLCERAGIPKQTLHYWLNGNPSTINMSKYNDLIRVLGMKGHIVM